jgi:hypothetical protein
VRQPVEVDIAAAPGTWGRRGRRVRSLARRAVLTAAVVAACAAGAGPVARAGATSPGAVPDATVDALIRADQLQLVRRAPDAAVAAAQAHVDQAAGRLAADRSTAAADRDAVAHAGRVQAGARATLAQAAAALGGAVTAHDRAVGEVAVDRSRLQALAVGWYTGGATVDPTAAEPLAAAQTAGNADTELTLVTELTGAALRRDTALDRRTAAAVTAASARVTGARVALVDDQRIAGHATAVLAAADRLVGADGATLASATRVWDGARASRTRLLAAFERAAGRGAPSILGPAALTAPQMTAWFVASGDVAATSATIGQLTSWYLAEGRAEGVRGDIAFAQAMVETGGFNSADAVAGNNYAGVGHCDTCASGLRFPSPLAGVRAQIQLLRTYADATLTTADLPSPPPLAVLAPQAQSVRGCCPTWNSLTGVWATDPRYGAVILDVYTEMLSFAVSQPAVVAAG